MEYRYALMSVYDKQGIVDFSKGLIKLGFCILSTGGTAAALKKAKIAFTEVSTVTGFPEMLDGRVKTLHPIIHAGILAQRDKKEHQKTLKEHHISLIDVVVCNLYPFESTIQKPNVSIEEVIENIDIGGPTLIRAAAKNYTDVLVVTSSKQYPEVLTALQSKKGVSQEFREALAIHAYGHTAQYDAMIAQYLRSRWTQEVLPEDFSVTMRKIQEMRYGENPHQKGAFYKNLPPIDEPCIATAEQIQGKELSFNNILDANCAIECIKEFRSSSCVIIKHATPCGIASAKTLLQAWKDAYATDIYSPYGGIVAFNKEIDQEVAQDLSKYFLEVIVAPSFTKAAQELFLAKKNLRLLRLPGLERQQNRKGLDIRSVVGGFLIQERDVWFADQNTWKVVTSTKPTKNDLISMDFAVRCVKHIKSNSVVFVKDTRTVGIGGGQTSRVDAAWIATNKGKDNIKGSLMASDAFFPFRDAVDVAVNAGVKAIIQPGGSIRDNEVIQAANEHGIPMVFTGQRYFRH
ncbi:MAG TPA: bifunctional phosphoribosylaminoimidazolecarboxamide formyltransferase/IMP cyclohydrolase [Thermoplasmata archaeon]|jgi:phosphoribosylaminoimidazolecarboxamide formyltransferase/IMP cyclohydrolase|nr:bifunctional phosphoribosylaminoimidazolecarboxamide formyltransferase/IMP cyclohydrolase [Thermoplasmata archaeon]